MRAHREVLLPMNMKYLQSFEPEAFCFSSKYSYFHPGAFVYTHFTVNALMLVIFNGPV